MMRLPKAFDTKGVVPTGEIGGVPEGEGSRVPIPDLAISKDDHDGGGRERQVEGSERHA